ncbi:MAG: CPBP family intramembrane metalloprotease, partial [Rhodocyclaceae bacterium]
GFRIFYSGFLFAFSHWFLWGSYWFSTPRLLIPVVVTTFVMGVAWMWLYLKARTLFYPMLEHSFVDIFNLSVAMFVGLNLVKV